MRVDTQPKRAFRTSTEELALGDNKIIKPSWSIAAQISSMIVTGSCGLVGGTPATRAEIHKSKFGRVHFENVRS